MRLWSTPESVAKGEVSALALFETFAAMAMYIGVGVYFDTWWHFTTAMLIAPFMLLRTEESVRHGWSMALHLKENKAALSLAMLLAICCLLLSWDEPSVLLVVVLYMMAVPLITLIGHALFARFVAAIIGFITGPLRSIRAIPENWWRLVGCLDFVHSPEVIPHPSDVKPVATGTGGLRGLAMYHAWGAASVASESRQVWFSPVQLLPVPIVISGIAFRLSIKGTAIIWLPLLWAAQPPKPAGEPWRAHIKLKVADDLTRFVVLLSMVSLTLLAAKITLFIAAHELALRAEAWRGWLGEPMGKFAVAFVRPGEIPIWQLASTVNAILALVLFLLLRHWLRRSEVDLPIKDSGIDRTVSTFYFCRRLLSTYTIGNHLVVFVLLAQELPLPTVGSTFLPWL